MRANETGQQGEEEAAEEEEGQHSSVAVAAVVVVSTLGHTMCSHYYYLHALASRERVFTSL